MYHILANKDEIFISNCLLKYTNIPLELWYIIYEMKYKLEYNMWKDRMNFSFSQEDCDPFIRTNFIKLRSSRRIATYNNNGAKLYNLASLCIRLCQEKKVKYYAYYTLMLMFRTVKTYFIWMYKRFLWDSNSSSSNRVESWHSFSKKTNRPSTYNWGNFFDVLSSKIDSLTDEIFRDYDKYHALKYTKKYKKIKNVNFDTWDWDETLDIQHDIRKYESLMENIKKRYGNVESLFKCVNECNGLLYFKNYYFVNWKKGKLTQEDLQFELSVYKPKKWYEYLDKCKRLRNGKLVGPVLTPIKFYDDW